MKVDSPAMAFSDAWRQWRVVLGSLISSSVGAAPVMVLSFGILLKPVSAALGWDRAAMSEGLLLAVTLNALITPLLGRLIDRHGVRQVTLYTVLLFGIATALMAVMTGSWFAMMGLFGLWGLVSAGQSQVPYVTAISATFERNRGLALGIGMCGLGVGAIIVPPLTRILLDRFGWRGAYVGLGIVSSSVAYFAVLLFVHVPASSTQRARLAPAPSDDDAAFSVAVRSRHFWFMLLAVFLTSLTTNGMLANLVPVLTDAGIGAGRAAWFASSVGIAVVAGKVGSGALVDKFSPQYVAAISFVLPVIGCVIFLAHLATTYTMLVTITLGFATGAEVAIAGTLVARFFGFKNYGEIFGFMAFAYSIGVGGGSLVMNAFFDRAGSYRPAFVLFSAAAIVAAVLIGSLRDSPTSRTGCAITLRR